MESDRATLELPPDLLAPSEARAGVRRLLERWGHRHLIDDAALVVSELVANAVEHAEPSSVVVEGRSGGVRIEVSDKGGGVADPVALPESRSAERGRGLMIVSALASSWGVRTAGRSKTVWVELASADGVEVRGA